MLRLRFPILVFSLGLACGCGANPNSESKDPSKPPQKTDAELIFAQEAGDLPTPTGSCPERTAVNVLGDPHAAVKRTAFGLAYCVLHDEPAGVTPTPADTVKVNYSGWTPEGRLFDSSVERGPTQFALTQVIRGWTEAVQLMTAGDKLRVWIPGDMAYGNKQPGAADGDPPKGPLIFEIELLEIVKK